MHDMSQMCDQHMKSLAQSPYALSVESIINAKLTNLDWRRVSMQVLHWFSSRNIPNF